MQIASRVQSPAARPTLEISSVESWTVCSFGLLLIISLFVLSTFQDYGISWDEQVQNAYGEDIVSYYRSGFTERKAVTPNDVTEDGNLPYYGGAFDVPAVLLQRISPFGPYETRHLLGGLVGLAGLVVTWRLGRRVAGPRAGFIALALTATIPAYYGHMFINPKDLPFAAAMTALLLVFCRILGEWPRPSWRSVGWLGLTSGVAVGTRVGAVIAVADLLVPLLVWSSVVAWRARSVRSLLPADRACLRLLAALPIAYAVMAALWPWSVQEPLNPVIALGMFSRFPFEGEMLFQGRSVLVTEVPRSYLPVMMAVTLPEILLAGVVVALGCGVRWVCAGLPGVAERQTLQIMAVLTAVLTPLLYFVIERPTAYNGLRHFLFILPPLAVIAAVAIDRVVSRMSPGHRSWAIAVVAVGMALPVARMLGLHPLEYMDFNALFGGLQAADGQFELDYWGVSLAETTRGLAAVLTQHGDANPAQPWRVGVNGAALSAGYFMPPFLRVAGQNEPTDFVIDICPCEPMPGSVVVAETTRLGVPVSKAYDTRMKFLAADP